MAEFRVNIDASTITEDINRALRVLINRDFSRLMRRIGQIVRSNTVERIGNQGPAPDGTPWADNNRSNNILLDTGVLRSSIRFEVDSDFEVEIGTDIIYGATHQFGDPSRNIIARPYLGVSSQDERDIIEEVDRFLQREIG